MHVSGTVTNSVGFSGQAGISGYQLEDATGKIYVLSRRGVPSRGSKVKVTGVVSPGVQAPGQPVGVAIREESHSIR